MKNSKKGFTLSEVLIVVAIIVIVSAAGMAGIAIAVQDANARGEKIQQLHGEGNWEAEANQKIKENAPIAGDDEVLEESLDTPAPTAGATSDSETLDEGTPTPTAGSSSTGTGTGSGSTGTGTGGGTTDADTGSTGTGTGTGSGTGTSSSGNTTPTTPSTNAAGSSVNINTSEVNNWNGNISFDSGVKSVVVSTEDPNFDINAWKYKTTPLGNNQYQITYTADQWQTPDTSIQVRTHGYDLTVVSWSS